MHNPGHVRRGSCNNRSPHQKNGVTGDASQIGSRAVSRDTRDGEGDRCPGLRADRDCRGAATGRRGKVHFRRLSGTSWATKSGLHSGAIGRSACRAPMINSMLPLPGLSPVSGKSVVATFDGGLLSSDGGVLMLRAVEQRLRIADRFAGFIEDQRAPDQITHALADIIRFRLLMIAAGYEDGDANGFRVDPIFKMALDLSPSDRELCSQSTISRLENVPDTRALLRMGRAMVDLYCESFRQVPKRIVLDIDDTFDAVHGGQQLRLFNAHYDEYGFQPIVVFDGEGRFVTAVLRP